MRARIEDQKNIASQELHKKATIPGLSLSNARM
jgi:hypothetical protein